MRERVQWIDTARFLGIFAIYLGHMGTRAGNSYNFVFMYHVSLFFFISGCMSNYDNEEHFGKFLFKKIKTILIPFYAFSFLSIIIEILYKGLNQDTILVYLKQVLCGNIRNVFFAGSLWFLTCLFVIEIIFKLLKYLKKKWAIFLISSLICAWDLLIVYPRYAPVPSWPYNLDSAIYYIFFFAIGYVAYPHLLKLFALDSLQKKICFWSLGILSICYAGVLFFGKDYIYILLGKFIPSTDVLSMIRALVLIWMNLFLAKLLEKVEVFKEYGRNTLFLCGNEYITTILITALVGLFNIEINVSSPLAAYVYTTILLVVGMKIVIPFEKLILK